MEFMACKFVNLVFVVYYRNGATPVNAWTIVQFYTQLSLIEGMMTSGKFNAGPHTKTDKLCSHLWPILEFLLCIFFFFFTVGESGVHRTPQTQGEHADRWV